MKRLIELIRQKNRARLERRQQLRASGDLPRGWLPRLVYKLKARNHERLARRRLRKHLLASLAANDTAVLEALVFLLKTSRQDQRARVEADEAIAKRLAAIEERVDAGVRLVAARMQVIEGLLVAPRGGDGVEPGVPVVAARPATTGAGVNGDLKHALGPQSRVAERVEPGVGERAEIGDLEARRS
jgi:hypothetical protein